MSHHGSSGTTGSGSAKSGASKTPGSKVSMANKDKTPVGKGGAAGGSFGSSLKNRKPGGPVAPSKGAKDVIKKH